MSCSYLLSSKERYERSNKHSYCFNELSSMIMVQSKPVCVSGVFVDRAPVRATCTGRTGHSAQRVEHTSRRSRWPHEGQIRNRKALFFVADIAEMPFALRHLRYARRAQLKPVQMLTVRDGLACTRSVGCTARFLQLLVNRQEFIKLTDRPSSPFLHALVPPVNRFAAH